MSERAQSERALSERALVAAIQLDSGEDEEHNFARARALVLRARERGARVVALPENLLYEGTDRDRRHPLEEWEPRLAGLARESEAALVAGSIREPGPAGKAYNCCLVFGPDGQRLARYRKIHLFDVDVPGGPVERESDHYHGGEPEPVVVDLPHLGPTGLAICYDLRFPELFRALVARGARTIMLPSSFALGTGKDHWLTLLKARAIENQCFVVAPDQFGLKQPRRMKFGKTAIVDPWGQVLAQAAERAEDVVVAELDFADLARIRRALPCLDHRRL